MIKYLAIDWLSYINVYTWISFLLTLSVRIPSPKFDNLICNNNTNQSFFSIMFILFIPSAKSNNVFVKNFKYYAYHWKSSQKIINYSKYEMTILNFEVTEIRSISLNNHSIFTILQNNLILAH